MVRVWRFALGVTLAANLFLFGLLWSPSSATAQGEWKGTCGLLYPNIDVCIDFMYEECEDDDDCPV